MGNNTVISTATNKELGVRDEDVAAAQKVYAEERISSARLASAMAERAHVKLQQEQDSCAKSHMSVVAGTWFLLGVNARGLWEGHPNGAHGVSCSTDKPNQKKNVTQRNRTQKICHKTGNPKSRGLKASRTRRALQNLGMVIGPAQPGGASNGWEESCTRLVSIFKKGKTPKYPQTLRNKTQGSHPSWREGEGPLYLCWLQEAREADALVSTGTTFCIPTPHPKSSPD
eukprot:1476894-Amphidinium_carterae.2